MKHEGQVRPIASISFADELAQKIASLRAITRMATGEVEASDDIVTGFLERIVDGSISRPKTFEQDTIELLYIDHLGQALGTDFVEVDVGFDELARLSIRQLLDTLM